MKCTRTNGDVLEEMRKIGECDMEEFGTLNKHQRETIAILRDGWWPQAATQEGDETSKKLCNIWKQRTQRPTARSVSINIWNRNGAPSRRGCVVNKPINKRVRPPRPRHASDSGSAARPKNDSTVWAKRSTASSMQERRTGRQRGVPLPGLRKTQASSPPPPAARR